MDFPKRKQPSSMFPTLPDVSPVVPLDALTHHTDMNYPTVNHAYGPFHRPKYYVGKCPSNQFVRNFDTPPPTTTPSPTMESYTETPTPSPSTINIKVSKSSSGQEYSYSPKDNQRFTFTSTTAMFPSYVINVKTSAKIINKNNENG